VIILLLHIVHLLLCKASHMPVCRIGFDIGLGKSIFGGNCSNVVDGVEGREADLYL